MFFWLTVFQYAFSLAIYHKYMSNDFPFRPINVSLNWQTFHLGVQKAILELNDYLILKSAKRGKMKICQFSSQLAQSSSFRWKRFHSISYNISWDIHDNVFSFFVFISYPLFRVKAVKEKVAGSNPYAGMSFYIEIFNDFYASLNYYRYY